MPKLTKHPLIFDNCLIINITDLKKWNYLKSNQHKSGIISWEVNGINLAKVKIAVNISSTISPEVTISYLSKENTISYDIKLVSVPSNLGKGSIYYFLCPFTLKRCRKLYLVNDYFIHRSAVPNGMYSSQIKSKKWRHIEKIYGPNFNINKCKELLYSKYFKKYYNDRPTKRYLKLKEKIIREDISFNI
ncbi:hypothetical protein [Aquimarina agarilytica]|uniref:hypothetical protein n=1 Tax=Aquimarina agarilytica TaxID=1087449 RepID=UPI000288B999|nr:hypothetical protein [Aquimarina agarilytica]